MTLSILKYTQSAALAALLLASATTVVFAAKTVKELKKDGYNCEAITGAIECRKGKDDVKYLCESNGTGCQTYKVGTKIKSNADKVIGIKPPTKTLSNN